MSFVLLFIYLSIYINTFFVPCTIYYNILDVGLGTLQSPSVKGLASSLGGPHSIAYIQPLWEGSIFTTIPTRGSLPRPTQVWTGSALNTKCNTTRPHPNVLDWRYFWTHRPSLKYLWSLPKHTWCGTWGITNIIPRIKKKKINKVNKWKKKRQIRPKV